MSTLATVSVSLAWNPSTDGNVAGYKIYYGLTSRNYTSSLDVGNVSKTTIAGLQQDTTYYFAATTYDSLGNESDFSNEASYSSKVTPSVPPALNALGDLAINENSGQQTVNLSGISPGSGSTVAISAVSSNPSLIPNPTVNYSNPNSTGALIFAPATGVFGSAVITVTANNGETQSNIVTRSFTVNVAQAFEPPTLASLGDIVINENASPQTAGLSGISPGSGQVVTISAISSNPGLIPNPAVNYTSPNTTGSLVFTAQTNGIGSAVITVTASNGQAQSNVVTRSFTVTVSPVSNPTLDPLADVTLAYGEKPAKINLSGIKAGTSPGKKKIKITAVSSNSGLLPNPKVSYRNLQPNGSMTIKPVKNAVGNSVITVTVNDGGAANNLTTRQFFITVKPNQPPTLDPINNVTLPYGSKAQTIALTGISCGDPAEGQKLKISALSSNPGVIPNPKAKHANGKDIGTLNFTPKAKASGTAVITVTVNDGAKASNLITRTFSITILDQAATNSIAPQTTLTAAPDPAFLSSPMRAAGHFTFTVNGTSGQQYAVQVSSDLIHWTSVETNAAPFPFDDADTGAAPQKFYRAVVAGAP